MSDALSKATAYKPHIWRGDREWLCGCPNGRGTVTALTGASPTEAYQRFKSYLADLMLAGMRWEVFP